MPALSPTRRASALTQLRRGLSRRMDPRAIHVLEGLRAGMAASLPVLLGWYMNRPELTLAALAALLTCLADPGGPLPRRLAALGAFGLTGAALMLGIPLLHDLGLAALMAAAVPLLFVFSMARVWGAGAQALGDLLAVTLMLAAERHGPLAAALPAAGAFLAGSAFAALLTLAIWRIMPHAPSRRAVADAYAALADYARELADLAEPDLTRPRSWGGRAAVRASIEAAREVLDETALTRPDSQELARCVLALEAADQIFAALIAMSDRLEDPGPVTRAAAARSLRRLRPLLRVLAQAIEANRLDRIPRIERAIAAATEDAAACRGIAPIAQAIAERLRLAAASSDPSQRMPGAGPSGQPLPLRARIIGPLRANLSPGSAVLRHAARIALVAGAALAITQSAQLAHGHWLTITLVLVMQPYFAHTFGRSLARMGGTVAGGLIAAGIALLSPSHLHVAGFLPLLGALALAVRQVNYSLYVAVYTPLVILLTEQLALHADPLMVARDRAILTIAGGLLAIAANALIWPAWEPDQAEHDLARAIASHAAFARAVLMREPLAQAEAARRAAGLATNNLEATIERLSREPRRGVQARLRHLRMADATLRRIGGRLVAWSLDPAPITDAPRCAQAKWVYQALGDLAEARTPPARPAGLAAHETLARMARQVELLANVLRPRHAQNDAPDTSHANA